MKRSEKILAFVIAFALFLKFMNIPGGSALLVWASFFLGVIYYPFGFAFLNGIPLRNIFTKSSYNGLSPFRIAASIGTSMAMSALCFGLLYRFQYWPGGNNLLLAGTVPLLAALVIAYRKKSGELFYRMVITRGAVLVSLGIVLLLTPPSVIERIQYRHYPRYLEARKMLRADPGNLELQKKEELEFMRMTLDPTAFAQWEEMRKEREPSPLLLQAWTEGVMNCSIEFYRKGRYVFTGSSSREEGVFAIRDSIINLDRNNIGNLGTSLKMVVRSVRVGDISNGGFRSYLLQLDRNNQVIQGSVVFRVTVDNRQMRY